MLKEIVLLFLFLCLTLTVSTVRMSLDQGVSVNLLFLSKILIFMGVVGALITFIMMQEKEYNNFMDELRGRGSADKSR